MRLKQVQSTKWSAWLSVAALIMLAVLSFYGLSQNFRLEKSRLRREVELVVREVSMQQQARFLWGDANGTQRVAVSGSKEASDSSEGANAIIIRRGNGKSNTDPTAPNIRMIREGRNLDRNNPTSLTGPMVAYVALLPWDSLSIGSYEPLFSAALQKAGLPNRFTIQPQRDTGSNMTGFFSLQGVATTAAKDSISFKGQPRRLELSFETPVLQILRRMIWPIALALSMMGITALAFWTNRRSLLAQQRLLGAKDDLISNIGHELKTPVATVGVALEALDRLQESGHQEKIREYLAISRAEVQRLGLLVEKVLQQAMLDEGRLQVETQPLNLRALTMEVCSGMQPAFDKVQGTLEVEAAEAMVLADEVHVASILYNLLDNAIKYRSSRPLEVLVRVLPAAEGVVLLEVADNGIGVSAPYQQKIFERFFRVPTPGDHTVKGHGLGLSYVQQVTAAMGGKIMMETRPDGGSLFRVTFRAVV